MLQYMQDLQADAELINTIYQQAQEEQYRAKNDTDIISIENFMCDICGYDKCERTKNELIVQCGKCKAVYELEIEIIDDEDED